MLLISPGVGAATTPLANRAALRAAETFMLKQLKNECRLSW
jgi:hypothetical protein